MDDRLKRNGLTFRAGEQGFVFYDDHTRGTGEPSRRWAFSTIEAAARWLVDQFEEDHEERALTDCDCDINICSRNRTRRR
ncbi:hypothetical protein [uncultured Sphingomonas sp.]|uniref:hypothetical protein n=1 Tax=uncultured Sphingomonas sp. TaxID=158754 RepID=UPI0035CC06D6